MGNVISIGITAKMTNLKEQGPLYYHKFEESDGSSFRHIEKGVLKRVYSVSQ